MPDEEYDSQRPGDGESIERKSPADLSISQSETQPANMEVHHHPHVEKKSFKEYLLEFLMIFLAVTMGFIAENLREGISDRSKAKEYIESLIQDLKTDTALAGKTINAVTFQMYGLDTLEMLLTPDVNKNDSAVYICYRQHWYLHNENAMNFSDRTITQLFSSGNMRLFKKQSISDRIAGYYSVVKDVDSQKAFYLDYFRKCLDIYQEIYEFDSYHSRINAEGKIIIPEFVYGKIHIANTNPPDLKKYKSTIEFSKRIISSYRTDIERLSKLASELIDFLEQEYSLKQN
jgi:hypothetical protein